MADLRYLMLNPYVVIRAGSLLRHAVDMLSLCVYKDLYELSLEYIPHKQFIRFTTDQLWTTSLRLLNLPKNVLQGLMPAAGTLVLGHLNVQKGILN